jgi:hypothetical protein
MGHDGRRRQQPRLYKGRRRPPSPLPPRGMLCVTSATESAHVAEAVRGRRGRGPGFFLLVVLFSFSIFLISFYFLFLYFFFLVSFLFLVSLFISIFIFSSCFYFYLYFLIFSVLFFLSFFLFIFFYSISFIFLISLLFLFSFLYLFFTFYFFLFPFFIFFPFKYFFPLLIFLLFEMRCKLVFVRIISCFGYTCLVRVIITICSDSYSDLL